MPPPPFTLLDHSQVIQRIYDQETNRIRVDSGATLSLDGDVDVAKSAADGDRVLVSDGTNNLSINPDGSINVNTSGTAGTYKQNYNEIISVGASTLTTIVSFTATALSKLKKVDASGTNISKYSIIVNSSIIDTKRTMFGTSLNVAFDFDDGYPLSMGDQVFLKVIHERPFLGDFNGRIQILEG